MKPKKQPLREGQDAIRKELNELCAAYLGADPWGRNHIMNTARRQLQAQPVPSTGKFRLVSSASLNQEAHFLNDIINRLPLTIVR
jgi:hypothetical protein